MAYPDPFYDVDWRDLNPKARKILFNGCAKILKIVRTMPSYTIDQRVERMNYHFMLSQRLEKAVWFLNISRMY